MPSGGAYRERGLLAIIVSLFALSDRREGCPPALKVLSRFMNFAIIGNRAGERAWADRILSSADHRLIAAYPGFDDLPDVPCGDSLEAAIGHDGVNAAIIGGELEEREPALARAAVAGLRVLCVHPPAEFADPYYAVELGRAESGAIVIPNLSGRLHPGIVRLRDLIAEAVRAGDRALVVRYEGSSTEPLIIQFSRCVDILQALIGRVDALSATADPPGASIAECTRLSVHLRGKLSGEAELTVSPARTAGLTLKCSSFEAKLAFDPDEPEPAGRVAIRRGLLEEHRDFPAWEPKARLLEVLSAAAAGEDARPDLTDGMRSLELAEAAVRSLKRGRWIELHYEQVSEAGAFKAVMTSWGCLILAFAIIALPVALVGPILGFNGTLFAAYAVPPVLVLFLALQLLRFLARGPEPQTRDAAGEAIADRLL